MYYVLSLCVCYLNGTRSLGFQTSGWSDRLIHHAFIGLHNQCIKTQIRSGLVGQKELSGL